ncbi:MAG: hypothetical protein CEN91_311 [Candidatus Berkelbacteria bacterium Licking1014_85]|uniref:Uncharacterized protein n=1 Tax=Candidatus Berkelbacteria bacterium Licking1014_85 TaxID=2017148 RepID=A0A554LJF6_9BACT|nr:MAG: hypothetical protein CEN91_311 [Candidatus Berkelbacteria bacterium Licking1014_85]
MNNPEFGNSQPEKPRNIRRLTEEIVRVGELISQGYGRESNLRHLDILREKMIDLGYPNEEIDRTVKSIFYEAIAKVNNSHWLTLKEKTERNAMIVELLKVFHRESHQQASEKALSAIEKHEKQYDNKSPEL